MDTDSRFDDNIEDRYTDVVDRTLKVINVNLNRTLLSARSQTSVVFTAEVWHHMVCLFLEQFVLGVIVAKKTVTGVFSTAARTVWNNLQVFDAAFINEPPNVGRPRLSLAARVNYSDLNQ